MHKYSTPKKQAALNASASPRLATPRGTASRSASAMYSCVYICVFKCNRILFGVVLLALSYFIRMYPIGRPTMPHQQITQNYRWYDISDGPTTDYAAESDIHIDDLIGQQSDGLFPSPRPIQVHFISDASISQNQASKFMLDGLERSQFTEIVGITIAQPQAEDRELATLEVFARSNDLPLVYIVDWGSMNRDCYLLQRALQKLAIRPVSDHLLLMDFSGSSRNTQCPYLDAFQKLKIGKRSLVQNRHYRNLWIDHGQLIKQGDDDIMHIPLVLREKFVDSVKNVTSHYTFEQRREGRSINVSFFWKQGDYAHYSLFRKKVAHQVAMIEDSFVDISIGDSYITNLLKSKIVVVAQRDEWEDHYRLMEALASGALVLTDPMLAMPEGLKNATNVVIYNSLESIPQIIKYYLENDKERHHIAKQGFELAMGRHRAWHRMEKVLFGSPQTNVDKPYASAPERRTRPEMKLIEH